MIASCDVWMQAAPRSVVIFVSGEIDASAVALLSARVEEALARSPTELVFDLTDVRYLNSSGIAFFVTVIRRTRPKRMTVSIRGLSDHFRDLFRITRLGDFLELLPGNAVEDPSTAAPRTAIHKSAAGPLGGSDHG